MITTNRSTRNKEPPFLFFLNLSGTWNVFLGFSKKYYNSLFSFFIVKMGKRRRKRNEQKANMSNIEDLVTYKTTKANVNGFLTIFQPVY